MKKLRTLIPCLLFLIMSSIVSADVLFTSWNPQKLNIPGELLIQGDIKKGDFLKASTFLNTAEGPTLVRLNSLGGDLDEAIRIGELLRVRNMTAYINTSDSCVSACVLILAGAVNRITDGRVGIHRPYLIVPQGNTVDEQKVIYSKIETKVKQYLENMNIPVRLYDVMFRIPPEKVRFLNKQELQDFGLSEADPFHSEANQAQIAETLGINRSQVIEYTSCFKINSDDSRIKCIDDVLKKGSKKYPK